MKVRYHLILSVCGLMLVASWGIADDSGRLVLKADQKEFLTLEPILVTVKSPVPGLSAGAGIKDRIRFDIKPVVKPRPGARPLPQEAKIDDSTATNRVIDLLEWYQFPTEGTFTVQASLESGQTARSAPITFTIRRPGKDDPEWGPVDRLHHMPWSNYITDAFCGDTFDVVKRWPQSKLAKYCHYWNGLHYQNKKEYGKAIESFRIVADKHPGFVLTGHAKRGISECTSAVQDKGAR